jgi:hypothetical protein
MSEPAKMQVPSYGDAQIGEAIDRLHKSSAQDFAKNLRAELERAFDRGFIAGLHFSAEGLRRMREVLK